MFSIDFCISYHQIRQIILKDWSNFGVNIIVKLAWQWFDLQFDWGMLVNLKYFIRYQKCYISFYGVKLKKNK